MHRYDLISCHDCGVLYRKRAVGPRERARCGRCERVLYRGTSAGRSTGMKRRYGLSGQDARTVNKMAAIVLGALLTFLIAQFFPIVQLNVNGTTSSATLLGAIGVLWTERMQVVASVVFCFTILFPMVELGAMLHVTLSLRAGHIPPGFHRLLRAVHAVRQWGMTEVLMLGILVTIIKMTSLARVMPEPALFAFGALTLMLAVVSHFDPRTLWDIGDRVGERSATRQGRTPDLPLAAAVHAADGRRLLACDACGLLNMAGRSDASVKRLACARCGSTLHRRHPDSVRRTWAMLLAAAVLYIPANLLPVMYTRTLLTNQDDTIISGVMFFWHSGSKALAIIIFTASILVPVLKLVVLALLAFTAQRGSRWRPLQRTKLYRLVEFVGRWSMLDIFVVTLTVALVRFQSLAVITAGPGALAFCAVVVLTMLAALQFDPRLIWDPVDPHGEKHV